MAGPGNGVNRLLVAAQRGDEQAFVQLTSPHRRALHVHAYRMLGNLHDADDALQETLLRAWRGLPRFEPRAALGTWLHRIATNVALRMIEQRKPVEPLDAHLQPYPDRLIDELPTPEEQAITRERLGLAYVAAMQVLPARQRAVLALREGLGWSARETGDALELSTPAVNSALQRARERLAQAGETLARIHDSSAESAVIDAFLDAWADVDIPRIVALLADDAILTMPPMGLRFEGSAAIGEFFATQPMDGALDRITHTVTRANGQPTLASYADHEAYGVMVFALRGDRIAGITGFPHDLEVFDRLGLPLSSAPPRTSSGRGRR
ncbi:MAG TPA: RNA polymerase subunit sigma-70 [Solirubrobacter sp.]|nr:RNA polymerase subunit sigma-70 [Solirubrobacter sp.]